MKTPCLFQIFLGFFLLATASLAPVQSAHAGASSWTGTTANDAAWSNATYWSGTVPTGTIDAWFNVANGYTYVDNTVTGTAHQICLGRSTGTTELVMTGGSLTSTDEFFLGQYAPAGGMMTMSGGTLTVGLNLNIGSAGAGDFEMSGGSVNVTSAIKVNRYTGTGATGYADISGGTLAANDLNIGSAGQMILDNTTITLNTNRTSEVNGYLSSGVLSTYWGSLAPATVTYSSTTNQTTISVPNGRYSGIAAIPSGDKGDAPVTFNYTGVRRLSPAPAFGVHPRILFNAADIPDINNRLANTQWGQAVNTMMSDYTLILRNGRSAYDALPSSAKVMPDGTNRIGNEGYYDQSVTYNDLVAGNTTKIAALIAGTSSSTLCTVLGSEMACEAFQDCINYSQPGYAARMTNLCTALDTWAKYATSLGNLGTPANTWEFGNFDAAMSYDFAYNYMTPTQQADVRKALAIMFGGYMPNYYSVGLKPAGTTSNWCALNTFEQMYADAIEGEVQTSDAGYSAATLATLQANVMASMNNFFIYGWDQNGASYEGQGKDYVFAAHQIAFAKRGYDFFGNNSIHNYADAWMPAMMQPYGYSFTKYDVLGGSGLNPTTGNFWMEPNDYIGLKWMYPNDNGIDFAFRNFINTAYISGGVQKTFLDPRDSKLAMSSVYLNELLTAAIFATDVSSTESWAQQRSEVVPLTFKDLDGGTAIYQSDTTANATQLIVHMRQNFGGHTCADRNTFGLSALGRIFVNFDTGGSNTNLQWPQYSSIVDVDGKSMWVTTEEGNKCRIPEKIAGWAEDTTSGLASFITGDATYAYDNQWYWQNYPNTGTLTPKSGYSLETNTFNTFRRSNNQIADSHGSIPFVSYPAWNDVGGNEGIEKESYNPMLQVYRTIGLVRGTSPYALVVDDVQKDTSTHDYRWYMSIPSDLSIVTGTSLPAGFNAATDVLLQEPSATGNRQLLVRILQANGTPVQASGSTGSSLAYIEKLSSGDTGHPYYYRLVIERSAVVAPGYVVMLYPMLQGGTIPTTSLSAPPLSSGTLSVTIGSQSDTFTFAPRTAVVAGQNVNMSEFVLSRGASTLIDYRNQIEPATVR
jgi:hypothetical protein